MEFIFMLTKDDRTVGDALDVYASVRHTGLRHVGFKDIGLPLDRLRVLADAIHADGREVFIEVVSLDRDAELRSAQAALDIGVDWLLGGTRPEDVLPLIAGSSLTYCPFPGRVVGHPSLLRGTIGEIAASAVRLAALDGVGGLDLLAYRYDGEVPALVRGVLDVVSVPVIAAGSVDTWERIRTLAALGVWGFTVGSAVFDGQFGQGVAAQIEAILAVSGAETESTLTSD